MKTLSSDKRIRIVAIDALLTTAALMLSFIEAIIPLDFLPLPGFRIGLANIAITVAAFSLSPVHAAIVSLLRVIIVFLLFGNPTSFIFSLAGGVLVIIALFVLKNNSAHLSFVGISVICATLHNFGQFVAAWFLVGRAVMSYLPFLLLASLVFGTLNGITLNLLPEKIYNFSHERSL